MAHALGDPAYRRLFAAQVLSLVGTGVMTVGLALIAYRIGGAEDAGLVLGGIFTLKMIAYVGFAPIASSLAERLPIKPLLVGLDLLRLALMLVMPALSAIWQVYALVFVFQLASAAFTPAFQSTIPEVLKDETRYAQALSLSRLAYNLESMLSPLVAGLMLTLILPSQLFLLTAVCFALSALLVFAAPLPARAAGTGQEAFARRLSKGFTIYLRTPRLRGLLAANMALALSVAWVLVNSVGYAGLAFNGDAQAFTALMAAYGVGSIAGALAVPRLLRAIEVRSVALAGAIALGLLPGAILLPLGYAGMLALWAGLGAASSLVLTPGGLVLVRSAAPANRPALFAAQFSLSHAGWLIAYPLAGWLGSVVPLATAFVLLGLGALVFAGLASLLWPAHDPAEREHTHPQMEHGHRAEHDRLHAAVIAEGPRRHTHRAVRHSHVFHIDEHHPRWPA